MKKIYFYFLLYHILFFLVKMMEEFGLVKEIVTENHTHLGTKLEIDNLQDLAKAYSDLKLEKTFSYYADEFLTDRFKRKFS